MLRRYLCVAFCLALAPAHAETPLTDLNGTWTGSGTDRDMPMQTAQATRCRTTVKAEPAHLVSDMQCTGSEGLSKRLKLNVTFSGSDFSGSAEQTSRPQGGEPNVLGGRVTGTREGDVAQLEVHLPGLMPNAHVTLTLTSPNSYSMVVKALGATLTDVTFRRGAAR